MMSNNNILPEKIPEAWLTQLKEALKPDTRKTIVLTILGSSVVAAVFTAGANIILEHIKASNNTEVEKYKACLEIKKEDLRESRTLYSTLAEKFRQFEVDFDDSIGTCELALDNPKDRETLRFAYDSLDNVAKRLIEIQAAARDIRINDDIRQSLNAINEAAGPKLVEVSNDEQKIPNIKNLPEFIKLYKENLQQQINGAKSQIHTAVKSLKLEPCN